MWKRKLLFGLLSGALALAFAGSASALTWGIDEDVLVQAGDNVDEGAGELGWAAHGYNSLTITGGYLEPDRIYSGGGENPAHTAIDISGGELNVNLSPLGYYAGTTTTVNMSGGIWDNAGLFSFAGNGDVTFNMSGGNLHLGNYLYMPGDGTVSGRGYANPSNGSLNFSGGVITIDEDWSAANGNILGQAWFNDMTGGAAATWDGSVTTVIPEPATLCLLGLGGGLLLKRKRKC